MREDHIPRCRADRDRHGLTRSRAVAKADEAARWIGTGTAYHERQAMPRLDANPRFRSLPDELRSDVAELAKIEWLVIMHGIFPPLPFLACSLTLSMASHNAFPSLARIRSFGPNLFSPLVQSSFANVHLMNSIFAKAWTVAVILER